MVESVASSVFLDTDEDGASLVVLAADASDIFTSSTTYGSVIVPVSVVRAILVHSVWFMLDCGWVLDEVSLWPNSDWA